MARRRPDDVRGARKRNERELLLLISGTLVVVGGGAVIVFFGLESFLGALPCLLAGAGAITLLYLVLALSERWTGR